MYVRGLALHVPPFLGNPPNQHVLATAPSSELASVEAGKRSAFGSERVQDSTLWAALKSHDAARMVPFLLLACPRRLDVGALIALAVHAVSLGSTLG